LRWPSSGNSAIKVVAATRPTPDTSGDDGAVLLDATEHLDVDIVKLTRDGFEQRLDARTCDRSRQILLRDRSAEVRSARRIQPVDATA